MRGGQLPAGERTVVMHVRRAIPMAALGLVVAGVGVGTASPAHADPVGSVSVVGGELRVVTTAGGFLSLEQRVGYDVDGQHYPGAAIVVEAVAGMADGPLVTDDCLQDAGGAVYCPLDGLTGYSVATGDSTDLIGVDVTLDGEVHAGGGMDRIAAIGPGSDAMHGGPGRDVVDYLGRSTSLALSLDDQANDGRVTWFNQDGAWSTEEDNVHSDVEAVLGTDQADIFAGNALANGFTGRGGGDTFYLGPGDADLVQGGDGRDEVRFRGYTTGVTVTLDGAFNDGAAGQGTYVDPDIEDVQGTPFNDTLVGNGADNHLDGYTGGVDTLTGLGGADLLDGDRVSATMEGGDGDDMLRGSSVGHSTIVGGPGTDWVSYQGATAKVKVVLDGLRNDGNGTDLVQSVENIEGGGFGDTLTGNAGPNVIDGGYPINPQHGPDDDTLSGQGGNDRFLASHGSGKDVIVGGGGIDTADFSGTPSSVTVTLDGVANDYPGQSNVKSDIEVVDGGHGNDVLTGSGARNELNGGPGNDQLKGAGGNDFLDGGEGADQLIGGAGVDQVTYADATDGVRVTIDGNADDGVSGEGDNVATDVENVRGSTYDDVLTGSSVANRLTGDAGSDDITGLAGNDTLDGSASGDTFHAGSVKDGADKIIGGSGYDVVDYSHRVKALTVKVDGSAGDGEALEGDTVGTDVERVVGGSAGDKLTAAVTGSDLVGGNGADKLTGGAGRDGLTGGAGNDILLGNGGDDVLDPGLGDDQVNGHAGVDVVTYADRTTDLFVALDDLDQDGASEERDNVHSDVENLEGGSGDDFLFGGFSDSVIWGSGGADRIFGGGGNDTLYGEAGNDLLEGDNGVDSADGGDGQDECIAETRILCEF